MTKVDVLGCPIGGSIPDRVGCLGDACRPLPDPPACEEQRWCPPPGTRSGMEKPWVEPGAPQGWGGSRKSHPRVAKLVPHREETVAAAGDACRASAMGKGRLPVLKQGTRDGDLTHSTQTHPPVRPLHKCRESSERVGTHPICTLRTEWTDSRSGDRRSLQSTEWDVFQAYQLICSK